MKCYNFEIICVEHRIGEEGLIYRKIRWIMYIFRSLNQKT